MHSETYIAYCFTEIQGYSKIGSYKGNGNTDGPFVYTGFKPAWVMIKINDEFSKLVVGQLMIIKEMQIMLVIKLYFQITETKQERQVMWIF